MMKQVEYNVGAVAEESRKRDASCLAETTDAAITKKTDTKSLPMETPTGSSPKFLAAVDTKTITQVEGANETGAATNAAARQSQHSECNSETDAASNDGSGPRHWTAEENELLREAVTRLGAKHWKKVAEYVPGRSHTQCLQRWNKVLKPGLRKGPWTKDEDKLLSDLVNKYLPEANARVQVLHLGCNSNPALMAEEVNALVPWNEISPSIPGRSIKQCRERWSYNLDPSLKRGNWTPEEDTILLETQKRIGNRWAQISRLLAGRTEHTVKTRFRSIMRARKREWKPEEDALLLRLHNRYGSRWDEIALHFPNRTKNAVNTRFKLVSAQQTLQSTLTQFGKLHQDQFSTSPPTSNFHRQLGVPQTSQQLGTQQSTVENNSKLLQTFIKTTETQGNPLNGFVKNNSQHNTLGLALANIQQQSALHNIPNFNSLNQQQYQAMLPQHNINSMQGNFNPQSYALKLLQTAELANRISQISEQAQNALVMTLASQMPNGNPTPDMQQFFANQSMIQQLGVSQHMNPNSAIPAVNTSAPTNYSSHDLKNNTFCQ